eukprot:2397175-Prymnesium_polylepis.1
MRTLCSRTSREFCRSSLERRSTADSDDESIDGEPEMAPAREPRGCDAGGVTRVGSGDDRVA